MKGEVWNDFRMVYEEIVIGGKDRKSKTGHEEKECNRGRWRDGWPVKQIDEHTENDREIRRVMGFMNGTIVYVCTVYGEGS